MTRLRFCSLPAISLVLSAIPFYTAMGKSTPAGKVNERLTLSVAGVESTIFDWSQDRCATWHIPDAPLRAFRNDRSRVVAFASHHDNRAFLGTSLLKLKPTCRQSFHSRGSPNPEDHNDKGWLTATWTEDGRTIQALVHNEYHADVHQGACQFQDRRSCWYNVLTAAKSTNSGETFTQPTPPIVVAAPPSGQNIGQGRHRGFFNPSNILKVGANWYFLAGTTGGDGQQRGTCLFESRDVSDPTRWRAWDGSSFSVRLYDPYRRPNEGYVGCRPVTKFGNAIGSVLRHTGTGLFIAIAHAGPDTVPPSGGIVYLTSVDLVQWDSPRILIRHPTVWSRDCSESSRYSNASIIDPSSSDRNFSTTDDSPFLFMTKAYVADCKTGPNRDLVQVPLSVVISD